MARSVCHPWNVCVAFYTVAFSLTWFFFFSLKNICVSIALICLTPDSGFRLSHDTISKENVLWLFLDSKERCGLATEAALCGNVIQELLQPDLTGIRLSLDTSCSELWPPFGSHPLQASHEAFHSLFTCHGTYTSFPAAPSSFRLVTMTLPSVLASLEGPRHGGDGGLLGKCTLLLLGLIGPCQCCCYCRFFY